MKGRKMNSLISVIVPVYNAENYLDRCIKSIINQKYKELEIILVDDGSKDNSLEICKSYANKDNRIYVIHKENAGVSAARNTGIEAATGDYIAFVDSDDYIDENMYFNMMQKASEYNCDLVMCDCYKVRGNNKSIFTHDIRSGFYNKEQLYKEYFDKLLMLGSINYPATISNWVLLIKRDIFKENNLRYPEGIKYSEDLLLGSQVMYYVNRFYYLKGQCYYYYIDNPSSATNTYYEKKWDNFLELYNKIDRFFSKKEDFDFTNQINYCLLFFIYNSIGDIYGSNDNLFEKRRKILKILNDKHVCEMFKAIDIDKLNISNKQKIVTKCYKYRMFITALIIYMSKK